MSDVDTKLLREFFAQLKTTGEPQEVAVLHNHILVRAEKMADELDRLKGENARQETLLLNMMDSLNGCNENNADFAKRFHETEAEIATLKERVGKLTEREEWTCFRTPLYGWAVPLNQVVRNIEAALRKGE